jgi:hypothetical protein
MQTTPKKKVTPKKAPSKKAPSKKEAPGRTYRTPFYLLWSPKHRSAAAKLAKRWDCSVTEVVRRLVLKWGG